MGKAKMYKIRGIDGFSNVYQNHYFRDPWLVKSSGEKWESPGLWNAEVFGNNHPITLELACGKGDYTIALAQEFPERNFIGVDIKGARIYTGAKKALELPLSNVAFARLRIENIMNFFAPGEIDEIWITFPDPFPGKSAAKRRLTHARFLTNYKKLLKPGGLLHLKTDNLPLYEFSLESIREFGGVIQYEKENIYQAPLAYDYLNIKTFYEHQHLANGRTINYLKATL